MKRSIIIPVLGFLLLMVLSSAAWSQKPLSRNDLEKQLHDAIEKGDTTIIYPLLRENRYRLFRTVGRLLDSFVDDMLSGREDSARWKISRAERIAILYRDAFGTNAFEDRVRVYGSWTLEQMELMKSVDSLNRIGVTAARRGDLDTAQAYFGNTLRISTDIEYEEGRSVAIGNLGNVLQALGDGTKALECNETALAIDRRSDDRPGMASSLASLGDRNFALGRLQNALQIYGEAAALAVECRDPVMEGTAIGNMGAVYLHLGVVDSAEVQFRKALVLARENNDSGGIASRLSNLGSLNARKGDLSKALEYFRESRQLHEALGEQIEVVRLSLNIGIVLLHTGEPDEALKVFEDAAETARMLKTPLLQAEALRRMAVVQRQKGHLETSLSTLRTVLDIVAASGDSVGICSALNSLGNTHFETGNYHEAAECYTQVLEIAKTIEDPDNVAGAYINLGSVRQSAGDFTKALEAYLKALNIATEAHIFDAENICYHNIGQSYQYLGDPENALRYYTRALEMKEHSGETKDAAETRLNIGSVYLDYEVLPEEERLLKAKTEFEEAMAAFQTVGYLKGTALCLTNLAFIQRRKEEYTSALETYAHALALYDSIGVKSDRGICLLNMGHVYEDIGDDSTALRLFRESLAIALETGNQDDVSRSRYAIGRVLERTGNDVDALESYARAIDDLESVRSRQRIEEFKTGYMEDKRVMYDRIANLLVDMGREAEAFEYSERAKSRALLDILSAGYNNPDEGIPDELLEQRSALEKTTVEITASLREERAQSASTERLRRISDLEEQLAETRIRYQELQRAIAIGRGNSGAVPEAREPLTLAQVQQRVIPSGAALIEYRTSETATIAWVLTEDSLHCARLPVGRMRLEEMIDSLRQPFKDVHNGIIRSLDNVGFNIDLALRLHETLIAPLEGHLAPNSRLIIIPDGALHYLPFESLVFDVESGSDDEEVLFSNFERVHFLVERYAISYSPSASVLDPGLRGRDTVEATGRMIAFGNPDFGSGVGKEYSANADAIPERLLLTLAYGGPGPGNLVPLPKSEAEVDTIGRIMQPALVYTGTHAREEAFKRKAGDFAFVHIATHGFADEAQPMYSHIVLAQCADQEEDGFLYAHEVKNMKLRARIVTLSACETGLGRLSRSEGLIGLTRSFLHAGASSVVVSLWSVDQSTSKVMRYFYTRIAQGVPAVEALRSAKLTLIGTRENGISFSHPFLWAPFVLVGEGR